MHRMGRRPLAAVVTVALFLATAGEAAADTFTVTKTADTNGVCLPGDCSLREAINAANALDGDDRVVVPGGTFTLAGAANDDTGASGDLDVTDASDWVVVVGAGGATTVDGDDNDRAFHVLSGAGLELRGVRVVDGNEFGGALRNDDGDVRLIAVTLESNESPSAAGAILSDGAGTPTLVIEGSRLVGNTAASHGGAIFNEGDSAVTITDTELSGNSSGGLGGGAIFTQSDAGVSIAGSTIRGNTTSGGLGGGAVFIQSPAALTVAGSTISSNTSSSDQAGGIFAQNQSVVTIAHSTLSGNRALGVDDNDGGGALWAQNDVLVSIVGSTLSGNQVARHGGGLYLRNRVQLSALNSTIAGNNAAQSGGGIYLEQQSRAALRTTTVALNTAAAGGGVYDDGTDPDRFLLRNTILAANTAGGAASDCDGAGGGSFTSLGNNLASTAQCDLTAPGDIPSGDALLAPLAANGGPTPTLALGLGSDALDTGSSDCPATDQRGVTRPQQGRCDIGAFELVYTIPRCGGTRATIFGNEGGITGTPRRDVIVGSPRRDVIRGLGGNDLICGSGGNDRILGGPGRDVLRGERGRDVLRGGGGRDRLRGGPGRDRLVGGPGRDLLRGGPGRDRERQ